MKTTLLFLSLAIATLSYSQKYDVGLASYTTNIVKTTGEIIISDSTVAINLEGNSFNYEIVKQANNIVYITDGVVTGSITISKQEGKLKKFNYDTILPFNQNINNPATVVVNYWCKERTE